MSFPDIPHLDVLANLLCIFGRNFFRRATPSLVFDHHLAVDFVKIIFSGNFGFMLSDVSSLAGDYDLVDELVLHRGD